MTAVKSTSKDALQTRYFKSSNYLNTAMVNNIEQALGKVVQSGHAATGMVSKKIDLI